MVPLHSFISRTSPLLFHLTCSSVPIPSTIVSSKGTKLKDFVSSMSSDTHQSTLSKLRLEVEDFAKQFPTIGFQKETMKYSD